MMRAPETTPATADFWAAAKTGVLMFGRCQDTGNAFYPPSPLSPFTLGAVELEQSSGEGTIYTWTYMAKSPSGAVAIAYVSLDEGPTIFTRIDGATGEDLAIGQRVRVKFAETDGDLPAIVFEKA